MDVGVVQDSDSSNNRRASASSKTASGQERDVNESWMPSERVVDDFLDANTDDRLKRNGITIPTKENGFIQESTLDDLTDPANLNSGKLHDVYDHRVDDFEEPQVLEVCYLHRGEPCKELLFVDPLYDQMRPRMCVSVEGVQAMHHAIAVLSRKIDNVTTTLKRCREAYYKELTHLREQVYRRARGDVFVPHETTFFDPSQYTDTVSVEMFQDRINQACAALREELAEKDDEIMRLSARIRTLQNDQFGDPKKVLKQLLESVPIEHILMILKNIVKDPEDFYDVLQRILDERNEGAAGEEPGKTKEELETELDLLRTSFSISEKMVAELEAEVDRLKSENWQLDKELQRLQVQAERDLTKARVEAEQKWEEIIHDLNVQKDNLAAESRKKDGDVWEANEKIKELHGKCSELQQEFDKREFDMKEKLKKALEERKQAQSMAAKKAKEENQLQNKIQNLNADDLTEMALGLGEDELESLMGHLIESLSEDAGRNSMVRRTVCHKMNPQLRKRLTTFHLEEESTVTDHVEIDDIISGLSEEARVGLAVRMIAAFGEEGAWDLLKSLGAAGRKSLLLALLNGIAGGAECKEMVIDLQPETRVRLVADLIESIDDDVLEEMMQDRTGGSKRKALKRFSVAAMSTVMRQNDTEVEEQLGSSLEKLGKLKNVVRGLTVEGRRRLQVELAYVEGEIAVENHRKSLRSSMSSIHEEGEEGEEGDLSIPFDTSHETESMAIMRQAFEEEKRKLKEEDESEPEMVKMMSNIPKIDPALLASLLGKGQKKPEEIAATKIQANFRGRQARKVDFQADLKKIFEEIKELQAEELQAEAEEHPANREQTNVQIIKESNSSVKFEELEKKIIRMYVSYVRKRAVLPEAATQTSFHDTPEVNEIATQTTHDASTDDPVTDAADVSTPNDDAQQEVVNDQSVGLAQWADLQKDLHAANEQLHAANQGLNAANEGLNAANQGLNAANEQLHATNEELSKVKAERTELLELLKMSSGSEQLMAANEKLKAANDELHATNEELSKLKAENAQLLELLNQLQAQLSENKEEQLAGEELTESEQTALKRSDTLPSFLPPDALAAKLKKATRNTTSVDAFNFGKGTWKDTFKGEIKPKRKSARDHRHSSKGMEDHRHSSKGMERKSTMESKDHRSSSHSKSKSRKSFEEAAKEAKAAKAAMKSLRKARNAARPICEGEHSLEEPEEEAAVNTDGEEEVLDSPPKTGGYSESSDAESSYRRTGGFSRTVSMSGTARSWALRPETVDTSCQTSLTTCANRFTEGNRFTLKHQEEEEARDEMKDQEILDVDEGDNEFKSVMHKHVVNLMQGFLQAEAAADLIGSTWLQEVANAAGLVTKPEAENLVAGKLAVVGKDALAALSNAANGRGAVLQAIRDVLNSWIDGHDASFVLLQGDQPLMKRSLKSVTLPPYGSTAPSEGFRRLSNSLMDNKRRLSNGLTPVPKQVPRSLYTSSDEDSDERPERRWSASTVEPEDGTRSGSKSLETTNRTTWQNSKDSFQTTFLIPPEPPSAAKNTSKLSKLKKLLSKALKKRGGRCLLTNLELDEPEIAQIRKQLDGDLDVETKGNRQSQFSQKAMSVEDVLLQFPSEFALKTLPKRDSAEPHVVVELVGLNPAIAETIDEIGPPGGDTQPQGVSIASRMSQLNPVIPKKSATLRGSVRHSTTNPLVRLSMRKSLTTGFTETDPTQIKRTSTIGDLDPVPPTPPMAPPVPAASDMGVSAPAVAASLTSLLRPRQTLSYTDYQPAVPSKPFDVKLLLPKDVAVPNVNLLPQAPRELPMTKPPQSLVEKRFRRTVTGGTLTQIAGEAPAPKARLRGRLTEAASRARKSVQASSALDFMRRVNLSVADGCGNIDEALKNCVASLEQGADEMSGVAPRDLVEEFRAFLCSNGVASEDSEVVSLAALMSSTRVRDLTSQNSLPKEEVRPFLQSEFWDVLTPGKLSQGMVDKARKLVADRRALKGNKALSGGEILDVAATAVSPLGKRKTERNAAQFVGNLRDLVVDKYGALENVLVEESTERGLHTIVESEESPKDGQQEEDSLEQLLDKVLSCITGAGVAQDDAELFVAGAWFQSGMSEGQNEASMSEDQNEESKDTMMKHRQTVFLGTLETGQLSQESLDHAEKVLAAKKEDESNAQPATSSPGNDEGADRAERASIKGLGNRLAKLGWKRVSNTTPAEDVSSHIDVNDITRRVQSRVVEKFGGFEGVAQVCKETETSTSKTAEAVVAKVVTPAEFVKRLRRALCECGVQEDDANVFILAAAAASDQLPSKLTESMSQESAEALMRTHFFDVLKEGKLPQTLLSAARKVLTRRSMDESNMHELLQETQREINNEVFRLNSSHESVQLLTSRIAVTEASRGLLNLRPVKKDIAATALVDTVSSCITEHCSSAEAAWQTITAHGEEVSGLSEMLTRMRDFLERCGVAEESADIFTASTASLCVKSAESSATEDALVEILHTKFLNALSPGGLPENVVDDARRVLVEKGSLMASLADMLDTSDDKSLLRDRWDARVSHGDASFRNAETIIQNSLH